MFSKGRLNNTNIETMTNFLKEKKIDEQLTENKRYGVFVCVLLFYQISRKIWNCLWDMLGFEIVQPIGIEWTYWFSHKFFNMSLSFYNYYFLFRIRQQDSRGSSGLLKVHRRKNTLFKFFEAIINNTMIANETTP